jgi:hypothetical protein
MPPALGSSIKIQQLDVKIFLAGTKCTPAADLEHAIVSDGIVFCGKKKH